MLTAIQIVYVFIALQLESNSTGAALNWTSDSPGDPWVSPFSLAAAIGSIMTAAGFFVLLWQSWLTRTQISQTQQEIDSTLRPWLGHTSYNLSSITIGLTGRRKDLAKFTLKNYGRLPARLTRQVQLWRLTEIKEKDLTDLPESISTQVIYFPDQEYTYDFSEEREQSYMFLPKEFYFGFILKYDFQAGQGKKEGKYGIILKCKPTSAGYEYTAVNTLVG